MIKGFVHKIVATVLVLILFAHNINTLAIIGDFIINQDFIAKTLCIQKEAQKGCNGKCQLRKELSENSSDSNSQVPLQEHKRSALDIYCFLSFDVVTNLVEDRILPKGIHLYNSPILVKTYLEVETPPPLLS